MINFISASDEQYEDLIYDELGLEKTLYDFISKDKEEIVNIIKSTSTKNTEEYVNDKLILIISIIFKDRNLKNELYRRALELTREDIPNLIKLYFILPENSKFKADHLKYLFENEKMINYPDAIRELVNDFNSRKDYFTKEDFANVYAVLGKIIVNHKLFNLLTINDNSSFANILDSTNDVRKIYIYNMFNIFSFDSYKIDLTSLLTKLDDSFNNEKIILNAILTNSLANLSKVNIENLDATYGISDIIIKSAKLRIVYQTFEKIIAPEISFNELEIKFGIKIDDIEELLYEGYSNQLFSLVVDYERDVVRVKYVRKINNTKENINLMKEKIENIRNKINGIVSKIDNITV